MIKIKFLGSVSKMVDGDNNLHNLHNVGLLTDQTIRLFLCMIHFDQSHFVQDEMRVQILKYIKS